MTNDSGSVAQAVIVRPMCEADTDGADRVMRLAFGTFLGLPDPLAFMGDGAYVRPRWTAGPEAAFCAELDARIVGSNFATDWGSVGFFGPLTTHPDVWDSGVGKRLVEPVIACFERWQTRQAGLYTFAQSNKHVGLYQRFGFWPKYLTAIMSRPVGLAPAVPVVTRFSALAADARQDAVEACRRLTGRIYDGLDVSREVLAVAAQGLGDTVLLQDDSGLAAFAVCHCGAGTEAGSGRCYVKFGAARPGSAAGDRFRQLLDACNLLARGLGAARLAAGVNTARHEAYRMMLEHGFRTDIQGIAMHRPNETGYSRPGVFVIDDWR